MTILTGGNLFTQDLILNQASISKLNIELNIEKLLSNDFSIQSIDHSFLIELDSILATRLNQNQRKIVFQNLLAKESDGLEELKRNIQNRIDYYEALIASDSNIPLTQKIFNFESVLEKVQGLDNKSQFDTLTLLGIYNFIGHTYAKSQYYLKAKSYFERKSLLVQKDWVTKYLIVDLDLSLKNIDNLSNQIDQLIDVLKKQKLDFWLDKMYLKKSRYHLLMNETDSSIHALNKVSSTFIKSYPEQYYFRLSDHYKHDNNFELGLKYALLAYESKKQKLDRYPNTVPEEMAIASFYYELEDEANTAYFWDAAMKQNILGKGDSKIFISELNHIQCLIGKSKLLLSQERHETAFDLLSEAKEMVERRFIDIEFQSDKIELLDSYNQIIGQLIDHRNSFGIKHEELFALSESAKGYALLDEILLSKERDLELDSSTLNQIKKHKSTIAFSDQKMKAFYKDEPEFFEDSVSHYMAIKSKSRQYLNSITKKGNNSKLEFDPSRTLELARKISTEQNVLSYFLTEEKLQIFLVKDEEIFHHESHIDNAFKYAVDAYIKSVSSFDSLKSKTLESNAQFLYARLLEPFEDRLTKDILIIPHGHLSSIPFDALIKPTGKYLVEEHNIHYAYSLEVHNEMCDKSNEKNNFVGFAPKYTDLDSSVSLRNRSFTDLPMSREEVNEVGSYFSNASLFLNEASSLQNFLDHHEDHAVIHIASHADINNHDTDFSYVAFANGSGKEEDYMLYLNRLYAMNLSANMIVLSACNTGVGKYKAGEGILSISRGFVSAGTASVISTLWSVSDDASYKLMTNFYKELSNHKSKHIALAEAKRKYIKESTGFERHPFYWAGFVAIGDMRSLPFQNANYWWLFILALIPLGLFLFKAKSS